MNALKMKEISESRSTNFNKLFKTVMKELKQQAKVSCSTGVVLELSELNAPFDDKSVTQVVISLRKRKFIVKRSYGGDRLKVYW